MPTNKKVFKQYSLDAKKVRRIKRIMKARTETEALEQLLEEIIDNDKIDRAHKRLVESGIQIVDTLGRLPK
jgi:cytidylate kinase